MNEVIAVRGKSNMVRKGKWISAKPQEPVSRVARRAIRERLQAVAHFLPLAALRAEENIEYVHQLRVATRRAVAAIKLFGDLTPKRSRRAVAGALREVRRAAGDARDLDVFITRLQQEEPGENAAAVEALVERLIACRAAAQPPIRGAYEKLRSQVFGEEVESLVQRVRWRGRGAEPAFGKAARRLLLPIAKDFFAAAQSDLSTPEALHQLRIEGKKLRYAMELLAGAFHPRFRASVYPVVEQVQEKLGEINDHFTAQARFAEWAAEGASPAERHLLEQRIEQERLLLAAASETFRQWWTPRAVAAFRRRLLRTMKM